MAAAVDDDDETEEDDLGDKTEEKENVFLRVDLNIFGD